MGTYTVIPQDTFDALQVDAGVLLTNFNPASPNMQNSDLITATTGGIQIECKPTYSDWGEDVDNCPNNTKELKHLDGWDCKITTTALGTSEDMIKLALGAYAVDGTSGAIKPRASLNQGDFSTLWWVGDRADGGLVAVKIINALSTGGFSLKTTKNGKGQVSMELTGHVSISAQTVMPMEFYSIEGTPTLAQLTVSSSAGASSGKTAVTVSGYTLGSGESYKYKTASTEQEVAYGDSLSGWAAWNGTDEITATNGNKITIAVADSNTKAVAAGSATVVSAT